MPRFGIGGVSGAKDVDQQAAYEAALTLLSSTLAGAQLIHDVGYMDNGTTGSLEQLVICHEVIGWIKQCTKELVVDEETLALSVVDEVVRRDGDFLKTEHTLRHYREDWYPRLTDRDHFDRWSTSGGTTLRERARAEVDRILGEAPAKTLPVGIHSKLELIVER